MANIIIKNKEEIAFQEVNEHEPYHYRKYPIAEPETNRECKVAVYEILPGKSNYPYHYHSNRTEVFYIISGHGMLLAPEGKRSVSSGDVIVFPASAEGAHQLINVSDNELLTYLDCDMIQYPDVVHYPNSRKIGVVEKNVENTFYEIDSHVEYYKGE